MVWNQTICVCIHGITDMNKMQQMVDKQLHMNIHVVIDFS